MQDVDRHILDHVGGLAARVVVLPTAAGLEQPASPRRWADLGVRHFTHLGARVEVVNILGREDAFDPRWLPLLEAADFIYFSGGSPRHLVDTMLDSPAWAAIARRHAEGAALAGCSAGAMAFGRLTLQPRRIWTNPQSADETWYPALGLLPGVVTLPHFDRWVRRMGDDTLKSLAASLPPDVALIGVDEDTALVNLDGCGVAWQVQGRQGVSLIDADDGEQRFAANARVALGVTA